MNRLPDGAQIHWYEVRRLLGQGGFGVTYAGQDANLGREVAIKEYFPQGYAMRDESSAVRAFDTEEARATYNWGLARFIEEARTLAQLRHPNIVRVLSVFEANGTAFMVMELEQGSSLEDAIRFERIRDEATLLSIALPLLDGLEHLHAVGFIHRDIKPANVLVRPDGSPVLIDFGSARQAIGDESRQLTSIVSRGYAPFEQYKVGAEGKQGPWTDIYSVAATLYRIVTGKTPVDALSRGTSLIEGAGDAQKSAIPMERTDYSARLLGAIDAALAFKAEDRPQSVAEWRAMLPPLSLPSRRSGDTLTLSVPSTSASRLDVEPAAPAVATWIGPALESLRVLVVDDEPFARNLAKRVLSKLGINDVLQAGDGQEALDILDSGQTLPDVVLTDLIMPGMDGIEFLRHLGERRTRAAVVLVSTEDRRILQVAQELASSHDLYILGALQKPIKPGPFSDLLSLVDIDRTELSRVAARMETISEEELVDGLATNRVHVVYQPKVAVSGRRVVGVEALARWRHPQKGILAPGAFIPLAEETGHIDALTDAVFSLAMKQGGAMRADGLDLSLSVNISVDSLSRLDLPEWIVSQAEAEGMDPRKVILEVTESRMMRSLMVPLEILTRLRIRGVGLSIDDYGTGHSSLEKIKRVPFTELKMDRAFVCGASDDPASRTILESSVALAQSLGLHVVAEGVESQADWDLVAELGCDTVQGYFASKPIEGHELPDFVRAWQGD